jgi:ATP-binding cassette, subfamily B, bacterial
MTVSTEDDALYYGKLATKHVSTHRVLALFKPHAKRVILILVLVAASSAAGVAAPFLLRRIIDEALPNGNLALLLQLAIGLIVVACLATAMGVMQVMVTSIVGQAIMHDLRVRVYAHLQSLSLGFFTATRTGEIQSRIASDIGGLQALVTHTAADLIRSISTVAMTIIAMLLLEWHLAAFSFLALPLAIWLSHRIGKVREALTYEQQLRIADMSSAVQESLSVSGIILTRTMGRTHQATRRFTRTSEGVAALEVRSHTAGQWEWALIDLALQALPALTLLFGGWLMGQGATVTIGTLVAMIALQEQLLWPLQEVLRSGLEIRTTRALFARIFEYLDKPVEIAERANPVTLDRGGIRGAVRLENVSFAYDKSELPTIADLTLDIPAGWHVAIVGATGSGKTTLGYLLARLYDVDAGAITYDGVDVRDLSFQSLTDMLGVVTQDPYLFHATIAENLRFAKPDATDDELIAAATTAQLHDLVKSLPKGYETLVGERGYRFSGGEKQRLSLARTILRNPRVLLLDEATSALDTATERAMTEALGALAKARTTITIAHRLSTIQEADEIVVLNKGRVAERGNHVQLLARNGVYAGLVQGTQ